jgi:predicted NBD/HSP70 family sugar kinase
VKAKAPGSPSSLRVANRERVLSILRLHGTLTQAEVARETGLSAATVSTLVRELTDEGRLVVLADGAGRRGRVLGLARENGLVVGVGIGHTHVRVAVADMTHRVLGERILDLDVDSSVDAVIVASLSLGDDLLAEHGAGHDGVLGVGVAVPGPIDDRTRSVGSPAILPGWVGIDVQSQFETAWGVPAMVENDANLGALGETMWGAARGRRHAIYLKVASGVGAGLVLDGRLFRGAHGTAGEIGHVTMDESGSVCRCGNRGCLETIAGSGHLLRLLAPTQGDLDVDAMVSRARAGDAGCMRVLGDAGHAIGLAVGQLCNVLNPEMVVVGGQLAEAGEILLGPVRKAVERMGTPSTVGQVEVVPSILGRRAEVLGAVALVLASALPSKVGSAHGSTSLISAGASGALDEPVKEEAIL